MKDEEILLAQRREALFNALHLPAPNTFDYLLGKEKAITERDGRFLLQHLWIYARWPVSTKQELMRELVEKGAGWSHPIFKLVCLGEVEQQPPASGPAEKEWGDQELQEISVPRLFLGAETLSMHLVYDAARKDFSGREPRDKCGATLLHYAAIGNYPWVKWLCTYQKVNMQVRNLEGKTPLQVARDHGNFAAVCWLLLHENPSVALRKEIEMGEKGNNQEMEEFLALFIHTNYSALFYAALAQDVGLFLHLSMRDDIEKDNAYYGVFRELVHSTHLPLVERQHILANFLCNHLESLVAWSPFLIEMRKWLFKRVMEGASADMHLAQQKWWTFNWVLAHVEDRDVFTSFVPFSMQPAWENPLSRNEVDLYRTLELAVWYECNAVVAYFLEKPYWKRGALFSRQMTVLLQSAVQLYGERDVECMEQLFPARRASHIEMLTFFLDKGADMAVGSIAAVQFHNRDALQVFFSSGAKGEQVDQAGNSLLFLALAEAAKEDAPPQAISMVEFLLSSGANPDSANRKGKTPAHTYPHLLQKIDTLTNLRCRYEAQRAALRSDKRHFPSLSFLGGRRSTAHRAAHKADFGDQELAKIDPWTTKTVKTSKCIVGRGALCALPAEDPLLSAILKHEVDSFQNTYLARKEKGFAVKVYDALFLRIARVKQDDLPSFVQEMMLDGFLITHYALGDILHVSPLFVAEMRYCIDTYARRSPAEEKVDEDYVYGLKGMSPQHKSLFICNLVSMRLLSSGSKVGYPGHWLDLNIFKEEGSLRSAQQCAEAQGCEPVVRFLGEMLGMYAAALEEQNGSQKKSGFF